MRSVVDQAGAPRVSVLLRTKDRPGLLAEALDSLRAQTFSDFETVLVNDGGPLPAGLLDPPPGRGVTVVVPPHPGGRSRGLNAGLAASRGTYVAYLDDDDLYLPEHLETLTRFLDGSDEYGSAHTSVRQIVQTLSEDGKYRDGPEIHVYGRPSDSTRLLYKNDVPLIGLAHRRALADEAGRFDESFDLYEDWDFLIRLASLTRLHHIPRVTAVYRVRDDASNVTATVGWGSPEAHAARRKLFEKYADRRSPATEMALVDGFDKDVAGLREERNAFRARAESTAGELTARDERLARLEAELRAARGDAARQTEESATREQALAVENAHLAASLEAVHRSLVWRLFTPWWKLRESLRR
jgi:glycosyltransferase involved in cell wall biosynthesis